MFLKKYNLIVNFISMYNVANWMQKSEISVSMLKLVDSKNENLHHSQNCLDFLGTSFNVPKEVL